MAAPTTFINALKGWGHFKLSYVEHLYCTSEQLVLYQFTV